MRKDWIQADGGQLHDVLVCCTVLRQTWDTAYVEVVLQLGQISEWLNCRHANHLQAHVPCTPSFGKSCDDVCAAKECSNCMLCTATVKAEHNHKAGSRQQQSPQEGQPKLCNIHAWSVCGKPH